MNKPSLSDLTRVFGRIGLLSFGGPAAQIALMHRALVDERKWLTEKEYLSALSFCMLLPGPEAMQLATWTGWRLGGTLGGVIAGGLFVLPGAVVLFALSAIYAAFGDVPLMAAIFLGLQSAVIALVLEALIRVSRRVMRGARDYALAAVGLVALGLLHLPFWVVVLVAGVWGFFALPAATETATDTAPAPVQRSAYALRIAIWAGLWLIPLAALLAYGGLLGDLAAFFSWLAIVTFGGAYAVLAQMTASAVGNGWLDAPAMMAGLGLAETTPGPLILVTLFVGFMAGFNAGGWGLAFGGGLVALWMTFLPSFLFIFAGAPYLARITANPRLQGALRAIMAVVVGVIAQLALWFTVTHLFVEMAEITLGPQFLGPLTFGIPDPASLRLWPLALSVFAGVLLLVLHRPLWLVLLATTGAAVAGAALAGL